MDTAPSRPRIRSTPLAPIHEKEKEKEKKKEKKERKEKKRKKKKRKEKANTILQSYLCGLHRTVYPEVLSFSLQHPASIASAKRSRKIDDVMYPVAPRGSCRVRGRKTGNHNRVVISNTPTIIYTLYTGFRVCESYMKSVV